MTRVAGAETACIERDPDGIREVWAALATQRARPTVFLTPEWTAVARDPASALTLTVGDPACGVITLSRDPDGTIRSGGGLESDLWDVLAPAGAEREVADAFARWLVATRPARVLLEDVPEDAPTLGVVAPVLEGAGYRVTRERHESSPYVPLPATFEAYVAALPRVERHELRRKLRRLEAAGAVTAAAAEGDEREAALARFFELHRLSRGRKGTFMSDEMEVHFRRLAASLAAADRLHLGVLRIDGTIVAVTFGWVYGDTLASYNSSFDPDRSDLAVGLAVHAYDIRDAISRGLGTYDLLRGRERYKYDLGARDRWLERLEAVRP